VEPEAVAAEVAVDDAVGADDVRLVGRRPVASEVVVVRAQRAVERERARLRQRAPERRRFLQRDEDVIAAAVRQRADQVRGARDFRPGRRLRRSVDRRGAELRERDALERLRRRSVGDARQHQSRRRDDHRDETPHARHGRQCCGAVLGNR
jgi:hypothetical protein